MPVLTGVNASKVNVYAVLDIPKGVDASKVNVYAVLDLLAGVNATKVNVYAVIDQQNVNPPVWPSITLTNGTVGIAYFQNWDLTPAATPTTYTLQSGSLPTGLSLANVSGDVGSLSGTPTVAGVYTFTIRATNSIGTADKSFTVTISTPSGGGSWVF